jgi:precorrin-3B C17-methyltransferase
MPEQGRLAVVGIGPGDPAYLCERAREELHAADTVIGYRAYCEQVAAFWPEAPVEPWPIGAEVERAGEAVRRARAGERIAVVSSGDAGVYGMAGLVLDVLYDQGWDGERDPELEIVPGVTAALAAAARLGAPLGVDFAAVSLSDLLVPWDTIERRLTAAAIGDLALAIYNPRSAGRPDSLGRALDILRAHRPGATPAAFVHDVCRPGERIELSTLADLDPAGAGMTTLVVIGCSTTRRRGRHLITSRPYARRHTP